MATTFTENLESARTFLGIYHASGRESFLRVLDQYAEIQLDDCGDDPAQLNQRFMTMVSGMLSVLFVHDHKLLFRKQMVLFENFVSQDDARKKVNAFLDDLKRFLDDYENSMNQMVFSAGILLYLKTCSLRDLTQMTVASIAEHVGYHPVYLSKKFKREHGTSLPSALLDEKMSRAYHLLKDATTKVTIANIAAQCGFADANYFRKIFKQHFGLLPSQVRPKA